MFKLVKRLVVLAIIGAVVMKVLDSRSGGAKSTGSASWPPIKSPGSKSA